MGKKKNNYKIGAIILQGIEPTEKFKNFVEKEKKGTLKSEDYKLLEEKYKMK